MRKIKRKWGFKKLYIYIYIYIYSLACCWKLFIKSMLKYTCTLKKWEKLRQSEILKSFI